MLLLSIYGSKDGVLNMDSFVKSRKYYPENYLEHIIDGGNHAAFGDYGTQKGDGKASTSAEDQTKETVKVVVDAIRSQ